MSATGPKRTSAKVGAMSAFDPKRTLGFNYLHAFQAQQTEDIAWEPQDSATAGLQITLLFRSVQQLFDDLDGSICTVTVDQILCLKSQQICHQGCHFSFAQRLVTL